jgi:hypothetical protein
MVFENCFANKSKNKFSLKKLRQIFDKVFGVKITTIFNTNTHPSGFAIKPIHPLCRDAINRVSTGMWIGGLNLG